MKQIKKLLESIVQEVFEINADVQFSQPDKQFGDLATNIAMIISKQAGVAPRDVAKKIVTKVASDSSELIDEITVAGPGFINIRLNDSVLLAALNTDSQDKQTDKKILVEFGQPNTHKLLHIGHLFSYISGESIARLLEYQGNEIKRANYQGDIGPHVAKCLYGWDQNGRPHPETAEERVRALQEGYQNGSSLYEVPGHKEKIDQINRGLYEDTSDWHEAWQETRQWSLDFYTAFEKRLGIGDQQHYFESEIWKTGKAIVEKNTGAIFTESNEAIVFDEEKSGLHTRVFLTKARTTTYEGKEMGLITQKVADWPFDLNITTTSAEQNEYFKVVFAAAEQVYPNLAEKLQHIGFGFVNLTTGKMSSRTGQILSAPDLLNSIENTVAEMNENNEHVPEDKKTNINNMIVIGAIKFGFLKSTLTKNITFDPESSLDLHGDTGPYVQYTHARIKSIQRNSTVGATNTPGRLLPQERELIKQINRFESIVEVAASEHEPHHICNYLIELCRQFNSYYNDNQVIGSADESFKIGLLTKVAQRIKTGLDLLGIEAPNYM